MVFEMFLLFMGQCTAEIWSRHKKISELAGCRLNRICFNACQCWHSILVTSIKMCFLSKWQSCISMFCHCHPILCSYIQYVITLIQAI